MKDTTFNVPFVPKPNTFCVGFTVPPYVGEGVVATPILQRSKRHKKQHNSTVSDTAENRWMVGERGHAYLV